MYCSTVFLLSEREVGGMKRRTPRKCDVSDGLGLSLPVVCVLLLLVVATAGCAWEAKQPSSVSSSMVVIVCGGWDIGGRIGKVLAACGVDASVAEIPPFGRDGTATAALLYPWVRDEWFVLDGSVLYLPGRSGGLDWWMDRFVRKLGLKKVVLGSQQERTPFSRFDEGGNILPVPGTDVLVVGKGMHVDLKSFLSRRFRLLEVDTSLLRTGHVDEIVSVVRGRGKELVCFVADPRGGLELLGKVPSDRPLLVPPGTRWCVGVVRGSGRRSVVLAESPPAGVTWKFIRVLSGKGAAQTARIREVKGNRVVVEDVWSFRGRSPVYAVMEARSGVNLRMPVWFVPPEDGAEVVLSSGSLMWLDGGGEEFPAIVTAGEVRADPSVVGAAGALEKLVYGRGGVVNTLRGRFGRMKVRRLPVVACRDETGRVSWLLPDPVNMLVLDGCALTSTTFLPPMDEVCRKVVLAAVREVYFLDAWKLNRMYGGVRCASLPVSLPSAGH